MSRLEGSSTIGILDKFIQEIINIIPVIGYLRDFFYKIINVIPNSLRIIDTLSRLYIFNFIELVILIISIVIINEYSPDKILQPPTPEGTIFIVFLIFIIFNVIHSSYLFLYKSDVTGFNKTIKDIIYSIPLYIIVFIFSLVVWFLLNILGWIQQLFSFIMVAITTVISIIIEMLKSPEDAIIVYKYGGLYAVLLTVLVILYIYVFNRSFIPESMLPYIFTIVVPLILAIILAVPMMKGQGSGTQIIFLGMFILFFTTLTYFYSKGNSSTNNTINIITSIVAIMMALGGLSILFYTLSNYLKTLTGWTGFFVYLIFYIPCLFIDLVRYILNEFKMTSNTIYVLLIFELIIILLYFYLPEIINKIYKSNKIVLLPKSSFLDVKQTISNSEMNKKIPIINNLQSEDIMYQTVYNQNYAFSMWVYLNPLPPNNIGYAFESQIFNYGDGKPKITYYNDITSSSNEYGHSGVDKYKIYFTNSNSPKGYYEFSMPAQKWNNITVNFTSSQADLFINGKLTYTYTYKDNLPNYKPTDFVTIGQNNGLDGAICNVVYYPNNLSIMEITNHYNLYMMKNPPY